MSTRPRRPSDAAQAHVVVVGVGGLGCPVAWALAEAGVGRLTLADPDVVALSNLPRQILFGPADLGRPKALVAAERLAAYPTTIAAYAERLDDTNGDRLLGDADLAVDATDGALAKDWLNAECVRRDLPLIHAAALRSEGRLLDVPAGGRPCLACLFGRLRDDTGSCADLGVWGGVVGAVGFLAAAAALRRLARPTAPSEGYVLLDLEAGRATTLTAAADPVCPVCARAGGAGSEAYPEGMGCDAGAGATPIPPPTGERLDLRGEVCPMNLLRARRVVEGLRAGASIDILLGAEGAASVPDGLRALGHEVLTEERSGDGAHLVVRRAGGTTEVTPTPALDRDLLLRFARQVVLPEVGEAGQRRILDARLRLEGRGVVQATAAVYLASAGVGELVISDPALAEVLDARSVGRVTAEACVAEDGAAENVPFGVVVRADGTGQVVRREGRPASGPDRSGPSARALGALLADAVLRQRVLGRNEPPPLAIGADGRIESLPPSP